MQKDEYKSLKSRLKKLQKKMADLGPIMRGSITVIGTKNKQPYISLNKNKKTNLVYLGVKKEPIARTYSENYKTLLDLIEEMTEINMLLIKNHHDEIL